MMMVTEHTTGTMVDYLSLIYNHQMATGKMAGDGFSLPPGQIVHQMRGVACGMQYLSELGYVHKVCYYKNYRVKLENEKKCDFFLNPTTGETFISQNSLSATFASANYLSVFL